MIKHLFYIFHLIIGLMLSVSLAAAQANNCPAVVETALQAVSEVCSDTGRNQACYANVSLEAQPQPDVSDFRFEASGDIVDVVDIASIRLNPLNPETGEWGVAVMQLQTSIPGTLPGQNVTFILFGDVELTSATTPEQVASGEVAPMQAFYLTTGIGTVGCEEAPENGLIVQTPEGVGEISFTVNDIEVQMGSTVLFQAQPAGDMTVTTVEGSAVLNINGEFHPVIAGTLVRARLNERLQPIGLPEPPETYDENIADRLPIINVLRRPIEVQRPFEEAELNRLREIIANNEPPCGQAPLPSCDHVPASVGGRACVLGALLPGDQRTACDEGPLRQQNDGVRPQGNPQQNDGVRPQGTGQQNGQNQGVRPQGTRPAGDGQGQRTRPAGTRPAGDGQGQRTRPAGTRPAGAAQTIVPRMTQRPPQNNATPGTGQNVVPRMTQPVRPPQQPGGDIVPTLPPPNQEGGANILPSPEPRLPNEPPPPQNPPPPTPGS